MRIWIKAAAFMAVLLVTAGAQAFTQCTRPVNLVWNNLLSSSIWITFSDGGSAIFKTGSQLSETQLARFASFALTAQASNRELIVRYPENGLQCPPTGASRNDVEGIWITPPD